MTKYEITATNMNDEEITTKISAPDEKIARRDFKTWCEYREIGKAKIITIEVVEENVPATKLQEIEAVQQIRDILATLGEDSYTATALEGCLDDAESNIENDFADSMKARYESAKEDADHYFDLYKISQEEHEKTFDELQAANKRIYDMEHYISSNKIDEETSTTIINKMEEAKSRAEAAMNEAATAIVENATDPTGDKFRTAVEAHRTAKEEVNRIARAIENLKGYCK